MEKALVGLAATALAMLGGCAETILDPQCWPQTCVVDPRYGLVTQDGKAITKEGKAEQARDEEERRRKSEEAEEKAKQQAEWESAQRKKLAKQEADQQEAKRARTAADEARGYKHVSFAHFFLDYKTLPLGSKRAVTGIYQVFGQLETLAPMPVDEPLGNIPSVALLTASASRDVRAKLLACRLSFCRETVLGHTTRCTVTWLGRPLPVNVCFIVDELW
jgi:hypothetical protein